ncbi:ECF transporter S component [Bacillus sp. SL00103]
MELDYRFRCCWVIDRLHFEPFKSRRGRLGWKKITLFNAVQAGAQALGWFVIALVLDIVIYAEPANKVFVQGIVAGISNIITVAY